MTVRHTSCRHCELDIEGFWPYRRGEWRDQGNNATCPHGANKTKHHAPYREGVDDQPDARRRWQRLNPSRA